MIFDQILVERNHREQAIRDSVIMNSMSRHTGHGSCAVWAGHISNFSCKLWKGEAPYACLSSLSGVSPSLQRDPKLFLMPWAAQPRHDHHPSGWFRWPFLPLFHCSETVRNCLWQGHFPSSCYGWRFLEDFVLRSGIHFAIVTKGSDGGTLHEAYCILPVDNTNHSCWLLQRMICAGYPLEAMAIFVDRGFIMQSDATAMHSINLGINKRNLV